jgi:hypothetical protein
LRTELCIMHDLPCQGKKFVLLVMVVNVFMSVCSQKISSKKKAFRLGKAYSYVFMHTYRNSLSLRIIVLFKLVLVKVFTKRIICFLCAEVVNILMFFEQTKLFLLFNETPGRKSRFAIKKINRVTCPILNWDFKED